MGEPFKWDDKKSLVVNVAIWALGQGTTQALLLGILASVIYIVQYEVPKQQAKIHEGYKEIADENNKVHLDLQTRHEAQQRQAEATFEKQIDRMVDVLRKP